MSALANVGPEPLPPVERAGSRLPADRNPPLVYLAQLTSSTSRRSQAGALDRIAGLLGFEAAVEVPWHLLRYQHTAAMRTRLIEEYRPATVNRFLAALRGTLKEAWRLGLMSGEDYRRAVDVRGVSGSTLPAGRELTPGEVLALARACAEDERPQGARDGALFAVLHSGGLRRAEVVSLDREDYDAQSGELRVRGKGRRERLVHLRNGAADALSDWLRVRGDHAGPLFHPVTRHRQVVARRLTDQAVYELCRRRAVQAGVRPFGPHDLRRTLAGAMLDAGTDLAVAQQFLGHASPVTTARYDRRGERAKREAAGRVHFPWPQRGSALHRE